MVFVMVFDVVGLCVCVGGGVDYGYDLGCVVGLGDFCWFF